MIITTKNWNYAAMVMRQQEANDNWSKAMRIALMGVGEA